MRERPSVGTSTLQGGKSTVDHQQEGFRGSCPRCGARRVDRQIGLERTQDEYVARLVDVFREVRRILRDEGTVWLNIGSSFNSSLSNQQSGTSPGPYGEGAFRSQGRRKREVPGLKPKDLIGIPWRVAFALQADGWYLRSEIIWSKLNPLPESVRDRPTKSHEQVFLLTKRERYFYDADAVREPAAESTRERAAKGYKTGGSPRDSNRKDRLRIAEQPFSASPRNRRTVWTIASSPFQGSHFAVMPTKLAATCIRAGTSQRGCCPACGKPWRRIVERREIALRPNSNSNRGHCPSSRAMLGQPRRGAMSCEVSTIGWQPTCRCDAGEPVPCRVFDPFGGVGTTVLAASNLGRIGIATELGGKYLAIAKRRLERPHARHVRPERADQPMPLFDRGSPCDFPGSHSEPNSRPMEDDR